MRKPRLGKEIKWDENVELPPPVVFKDELEEKIKRWSKDLRWIRRAFLEIATYGNLLMDPGPFLIEMIKYCYLHDKRTLNNIEKKLKKVKREIENAAPYDENNIWTVQCREHAIARLTYYLEIIDAIKRKADLSLDEIEDGINAIRWLSKLLNAENVDVNEEKVKIMLERIKKLVSVALLEEINEEQRKKILKALEKLSKNTRLPKLNGDLLLKLEAMIYLCDTIYYRLTKH